MILTATSLHKLDKFPPFLVKQKLIIIKMIRLLPLMLTISFLLLLTHMGYSRSTKRDDIDLISDGSDSDHRLIQINLGEISTPVACEPQFGFLPCTTNIWGHLFMIIVYQYLLAQGEMYVSSATHRFIQIHGPGSILGGSLFHLLPTIPRSVLVLASGLSGSKETAEQQAAMGMQLLAGSAVMMLTLVWGACVAFGSYDTREGSISSYPKPFSLITDFGVKTDLKSRWIARIMLVSVIPLIILQLPKMMNSSSGNRLIILVALIVTSSLLIIRVAFQVMEPRILKWRFKHVLRKYVNEKIITHLCTIDGDPDEEAIQGTFGLADKNHDKMLTTEEVRNFLRGLHLEEYDPLLGMDDYVENIMREIDSDPDQQITEKEFDKAILKWIKNSKKSEQEEQCDENKSKKILSKGKLLQEYLMASFELIMGIAIVVVLAMPYLQAVVNFSVAANISQMWVAYVVIPFAMNFKPALAMISMARQNNLMLTKIYGGVCLGNLVSLSTFLALVYARDLSLDVSADVMVVLVICTSMGLLASFCEKFPFWISFIAILLYPISLLLLYVFTIVLGWS